MAQKKKLDGNGAKPDGAKAELDEIHETAGLDGIHEIAKWTGFSVTWLYAQTAAGTIPHFKCGKYVRFKKSEIAAWIAAQHRGPRPEPAER